MRNRLCLALLAVLAAALSSAPPAAAQDTTPDANGCFDDVPGISDCIDPLFLRYWIDKGGLRVFGYPISPIGSERNAGDGEYYPTQWFQRHRMEYHEENEPSPDYRVLLGFLGREARPGYAETPVPSPDGPLLGNCRPFSQPGISNSICGRFRAYWERFGLNLSSGDVEAGALALHGYPISPVVQISIGGRPFRVQWFQRARFEWHGPCSVDNRPIGFENFDVEFGLLGSERIGGAVRSSFISLPLTDQSALPDIAGQKGLTLLELAFGETIVGAAGFGAGTALLLTPPADDLGVGPEELAANPARLSGVAFGALRLAGDLPALPADLYAVTLSEDGRAMRLAGPGDTFEIPAVIRALPVAHSTPAALVAPLTGEAAVAAKSNRQICFSWGRTQVCGLLDLGPRDDDAGTMADALRQLNLSREQVDVDQALPAVAGSAALDTCARAFGAGRSEYGACTAPLLAAPAGSDDALRPDDPGRDLGVILLRDDLRAEIFRGPELSEPADILPAGVYVAEALVFEGDRVLADGARLGRVRLSGTGGEYYLPAVIGPPALGASLSDYLPEREPAQVAAGTSLTLRGACFLSVERCPVRP